MPVDVEAQKYFAKAEELFDSLEESDFSPEVVEKHRSKLVDVSSYLRLAIERSNGNYPAACSFLARIMLLFGDLSKSKQYAQMAIREQPQNFSARLTLFFLECSDLEGYNPYVDQTSLTGTLLTGGFSMLKRSSKKGNVKSSALLAVKAYQHQIQQDEDKDIEHWLAMSEGILAIAEILHTYGIQNREIYEAVLSVPWDQIELGEHSEQVADLKIRTEGRMHLLK